MDTSLNKQDSSIEYSLNYIRNLHKTGFNYTIPDDTMMIMNRLARQVGAPSYIKTPVFNKNDDKYKHKSNNRLRNKKKNPVRAMSDKEWEDMTNFKTTELSKPKTDIEKEINSIRVDLNKLTWDNYDDIMCDMIMKMNPLVEEASVDNLEKIGETIFDIGAGNAYYSNLYAKFYKALIDRYSVMTKVFELNCKKFMNNFDVFEKVDAESDYDKYCEMNIYNEKRRSILSFITNLTIEGVMEMSRLTDYISTLIIELDVNVKIKDNEYICSEIAQLLNTIFKVVGEKIQSVDDFDSLIYDYLTDITEFSTEKAPSLTNKVKFSIMDSMDLIMP